LKRSLGRFVKAGGLDVERIQAQISEGRVEIEGLEVNEDESCNIFLSAPGNDRQSFQNPLDSDHNS
jgi:hypothetical protein